MKQILIVERNPEEALLNDRVFAALAGRLNKNQEYTSEESQQITTLDRSLFGGRLVLNDEQTTALRSLAKLSQIELKQGREISSHRKYIGPIIVFFKKLSWPLIRVHLKEPFDGLREFSEWMVFSHARQIEEIEKLKSNRS